MDSREQNVRTWSMLCHLAALGGFIFSILVVLGPLLVWQIKKNELPEIDPHGKAAVNFQLTVFIINLILTVVMLSFWGFGFGFGIFWRSPFYMFGGGFGLGMLIGLVNLASWILAIVAGIKANNGEKFKYPLSITFIK